MTGKPRRLAVLSGSKVGLNRSFFAPDRPEFAGHAVREDVFVMPGLLSSRLLIALCVRLLSRRYDLVTSNE